MKLTTFSTGSGDRLGVADTERGIVRDATELLGGTDLVAVMERWDTYRDRLENDLATQPGVPLEAVTLRAPLRPVRNVFAVGKNYRDHVREFGRSGYDTPSRSEDLPDKPIIFSKATTSVTGP